jgi:hypothetical protein
MYSSNNFCNFLGTTVKRSGGEKEKQKENGCGSEDEVGSEDEDGSGIKDGSEYTPSIIAPTTSTISSQQLLSNEDSVLFLTVFDELINSSRQITKAVVYDKLRAEPKLSHLEKQCAFRQLANKVRTERRRRGRIIARGNDKRKRARK